ncbi:hypothetical protein O6H91_15G064400 [Diphasiastrum complanatum]|uniref:Uncharacterized protein n=1 Tax=Diphasiastrum complanatum TaxID=34168 RepID=A0ACC2BJ16_DIPCM|nr:hypothetical protein O6H91_15G064400 [Diphasiastrum complanatum]
MVIQRLATLPILILLLLTMVASLYAVVDDGVGFTSFESQGNVDGAGATSFESQVDPNNDGGFHHKIVRKLLEYY